MRPIYGSVAGNGNSQPIVLDQYIAPGNMIFTVILAGGTSATVAIQHTNDDIFATGYNPATGNWEPYAATPFPATLTSTDSVAEGAYAYAPRAMRFVVTATAGTNPQVNYQVVQAGITT